MKHPQFRFTTATIAATALALTAATAGATQLDLTQFDYLFKVKFTGYAGSTTLTNFPVLVKINESNGSAFLYANCPNGADLRFADATGELLPHEIDTWDPYGTSLVWVKVPLLDATTVITACYGYKGEDPLPAVTVSDVWDNGYVAVWHLNADSTATTQADSTANALTLSEMPYQTQAYVTPGVAGVVGSCAQFGINASSQGSYGRDDSTDQALAGFAAYTFEVWSWQDNHDLAESTGPYFMRYCNYDPRTPEAYRFMELEGSGKTILYAYGDAKDYQIYPNDDKPFPVRAEWNYHAVAIDSALDTRRIFLNGNNLKSSTGVAALKAFGGYFWLGNSHCWDGRAFPGKLDEVRISNVARSDDWVKATYDTVNSISFAQYEEAALANDWTKYKCNFTVSFNNYTGSTTLTDFPVLVKLSAGCFDGFSYADFKKPNGGDLRFSDEAGNILPSEVDCWDTNGTSCVWVKVPSLNANTKIVGHYGWAPAPDVDATAVWDSGYAAVWHLGSDATTQRDSTANAIVLAEAPSQTQAYVTPAVQGVVGNAAQFGIKDDKTGCYTYADSGNKLTGFSAYTLEFWSWQDDHDPAENTGAYYMRHSTYERTEDVYRLQEFKSGSDERNGMAILYSYTTGSTSAVQTYDGTKLPARAAWNYQVFAIDANSRRFFLNDERLKNSSGQANPLITNTDGIFWLGNSHQWDGAAFPGKLDEVRISRVARSDDWIKATYDTIAGDLVTIGRTKSPTRIILR